MVRDTTLEISGNFADSGCEATRWTLEFSSSNGSELSHSRALKFSASIDPLVDNLRLSFYSPRDEAFFGLGENAGHGDLRGAF